MWRARSTFTTRACELRFRRRRWAPRRSAAVRASLRRPALGLRLAFSAAVEELLLKASAPVRAVAAVASALSAVAILLRFTCGRRAPLSYRLVSSLRTARTRYKMLVSNLSLASIVAGPSYCMQFGAQLLEA